VLIYPMDLKHECEFLYQLNPLPEWNKSWRDFRDLNSALYPIGNGVKAGDRESAPPMSYARES
jgi:hypothetical protein